MPVERISVKRGRRLLRTSQVAPLKLKWPSCGRSVPFTTAGLAGEIFTGFQAAPWCPSAEMITV
jgi:hypothetical protein